MYSEDDLLPISGLSQLLYCERRCALIHIEQVWAENRLTAEGRIMHEKVHTEHHETRGGVRVEYGLPLRSLELGLIGRADVVEFHRSDTGKNDRARKWRPFPVEYKRGRPKPDQSDLVQLCAQALCLEEMLEVAINGGAVFYGKTRRRLEVAFDVSLRQTTTDTARRFHQLIESGVTPKPVYDPKCDNCSLISECLPRAVYRNRNINDYLIKAIT